MQPYLYVLFSFIVTVSAVLLIKPFAYRIGLVDCPGDRKHHTITVPLIGGLCIFIAVMLSVLIFVHDSRRPYVCLFVGCFILLGVGIWDDIKDISAKTRLVVQLLVALLLIYPGGMVLSNLGFILGPHIQVALGYSVGAVLMVFVVFALINAMNMVDGQDGLLGGVTLIQLFSFTLLSKLYGLTVAYHLLMLILGSLSGFLAFNFRWPWQKQASVFMGDAGSTVMGFVTAWFFIYLVQHSVHRAYIHPVVLLWIIAFPLYDISSAMIRRALNNQSPLRGDRGHLHHIIERSGISPMISSLLLYAMTAVFCAIGVVGGYLKVPDYLLFSLFIVGWLMYLFFIIHANKKQKLSLVR